MTAKFALNTEKPVMNGVSALDESERLSFTRLCALFTLLALATSRVTLLLHELIGHALLAWLSGSGLAEYRFFAFGGGWVRYAQPDAISAFEAHGVALGGVALELLLSASIFLWMKRTPGMTPRSPWRFSLTLYASIIAIHALFYAVAGIHYGFGDGRALHWSLGGARAAVVATGALALCLLVFVFVRDRTAEWSSLLGDTRFSMRLTKLALAALLAGACHVGLTVGEQRLFGSQTHDQIMASEQDRSVEGEVESFVAAQKAAGVEPSAAELEEFRALSLERHRPFPLYWVLFPAFGVAAILGASRSRRNTVASVAPPSWRHVAVLGALLVALVALILLLNAI
ncbi:MAG: hypothetical protein CO108_23060 [Deltaproteobacteria bacterium CG_4_9_14_3_um_filter_63_12]|nr:MAG: hypothetical protein CO108_23060 [Deltaproteobacteria bacterium CG_4_9_14_3_um_filter_63_12]